MTDPRHKFTLKVRDIEASAVGRPAVQLMHRVVDLLRFVAVALVVLCRSSLPEGLMGCGSSHVRV